MNPEQAEILRTAREKLRSGEDDLILEAINALAETNLDESSELVISCLDSTNEKIRLSAVRALGILKPENTVELLTALLQKESSPFVRATAAIALGNTKKMESLSPLAGLLRDEDARVRANAVEGVTQLGYPPAIKMLTPLLEDKSSRVKTNVAMALWKFGGLRMISYLEKMLSTGINKWERASAAYALGEIGGFQAMSTLLSSLHDRKSEVKRNVIRSLGKVGDMEISSRLLKFLEDKDPLVRANTLEAVGLLGGEQYLNVIVARLLQETDEAVLDKATVVLEHLVETGSEEIVVTLKDLLFSASEPVKLALLKAFQKHGTHWSPVFKVEIIMDLHNLMTADNSKLVKAAARKATKSIRKELKGRK